jgi:NAD(P)-dependent dehydrogenase (short-subunit alcohol dehydrogenase family)
MTITAIKNDATVVISGGASGIGAATARRASAAGAGTTIICDGGTLAGAGWTPYGGFPQASEFSPTMCAEDSHEKENAFSSELSFL